MKIEFAIVNLNDFFWSFEKFHETLLLKKPSKIYSHFFLYYHVQILNKFCRNFQNHTFFREFDEILLLVKPSKIKTNVSLLWKPSKIWWKISESHKFFHEFHRSVLLGKPSKTKYYFFCSTIGKTFENLIKNSDCHFCHEINGIIV